MEILLWAIVVVLALQLAFTLWNLGQLKPAGGTGIGRRWLDGEIAAAGSSAPPATTGAAGGGNRHSVQCSTGGKGTGSGRDNSQLGAGARSLDVGSPASASVGAPGRPRLSILIPARNEAHNIGACVRSVLSDPSPCIEVLVLDDRSDDGTYEAAVAAGEGDTRLQVISGEPLPPRWMGKSYACWQLASRARGEWLLYLDADARLEPGGLASLMDAALEQRSGLVTGFPRQYTGSWLEKLIVPMMAFTIGCHLPIRLVRTSPNPQFAAAHGACVLISQESYWRCGGHAVYKAHLVDDVQLARAVKQAGMPVSLRDVCGQVTMRMYNDAAGVWTGYMKNIYAGLGRSPALLGAIIALYSLLYLVPPMAVLISLLAGGNSLLVPAMAGWLLGIAIKLAIDLRHRQPAWLSLLLPLSITALIGLSMASWRASATGKGYVWKGRHYS